MTIIRTTLLVVTTLLHLLEQMVVLNHTTKIILLKIMGAAMAQAVATMITIGSFMVELCM
jgi:hypothetical protein